MRTPPQDLDEERKAARYSESEILFGVLLLGLVLCFVLFQIASHLKDVPDGQPVNEDLVKLLFDLSKACAMLGIGSGLGAVVGHLVRRMLDRREKEREWREARRLFLFNTLEELKSAYDTVESARLFIVSHKSAKTYTEQIGRMPDVLASLRSVERALMTDARGSSLRDTLQEKVKTCIGFIEGVLEEYMIQYPEVARKQTEFEDQFKIDVAEAKKNGLDYPLKISPALQSVTRFGPVDTPPNGGIPEASGEISTFFATINEASKALRSEIGRLSDPDDRFGTGERKKAT